MGFQFFLILFINAFLSFLFFFLNIFLANYDLSFSFLFFSIYFAFFKINHLELKIPGHTTALPTNSVGMLSQACKNNAGDEQRSQRTACVTNSVCNGKRV